MPQANVLRKALKEKNVLLIKEIGRLEGFEADDEIGDPDKYRKQAWKLLLQIQSNSGWFENGSDDEKPILLSRSLDEESKIELAALHRQVSLDVARSKVDILDPKDLTDFKQKVVTVICNTMKNNSFFHYYQGYHDIAQVLWTVMSHDFSECVLERMSIIYLRDFLYENMNPVQDAVNLIHCLIEKECPEGIRLLEEHQIGVAICISQLLTWFSHDSSSINSLKRLFDFLICSHPKYLLYLISKLYIKALKQLASKKSTTIEEIFLTLKQSTNLHEEITTNEFFQDLYNWPLSRPYCLELTKELMSPTSVFNTSTYTSRTSAKHFLETYTPPPKKSYKETFLEKLMASDTFLSSVLFVGSASAIITAAYLSGNK